MISRPAEVAQASVEADLRAGNLVRPVHSRLVVAECTDCGRSWRHTASAASHARSARHVVTVDYRATFDYVPAEHRGGGR